VAWLVVLVAELPLAVVRVSVGRCRILLKITQNSRPFRERGRAEAGTEVRRYRGSLWSLRRWWSWLPDFVGQRSARGVRSSIGHGAIQVDPVVPTEAEFHGLMQVYGGWNSEEKNVICRDSWVYSFPPDEIVAVLF
jgi:hypothetical protein